MDGMADRERELGHATMEEASDLPENYHLDESDPDILVLRRGDGSFVAAFSAQGATREGIVEAAREDYGDLLARLLQKEGKRPGGHDEGSDLAGTRG